VPAAQIQTGHTRALTIFRISYAGVDVEITSNNTTRTHSVEIIERRIYFIRTHKVMLDSNLAELYGVTTNA